jgi:lipoic acid synthetase
MPGTPHRFPEPQTDPASPAPRKPDWLTVRLPHGDGYERVKAIIEKARLATVRQQARCPNVVYGQGGARRSAGP